MYTSKNFRIVLIILLSAVVTGLTAQDGIDRNVTIEREFQPIIEDAGKITGLPEILEIEPNKERVYYTEIDQPLPFSKSILTLPGIDIPKRMENELLGAFLRLGAGNYWNTLGDLALPIIKNEKNRLDLLINHLGTFGEKQHAFSKGVLNFNHYFPSYDLYAGVAFSHQYFNYYGNRFDGAGNVLDLDLLATDYPTAVYEEKHLELITRLPRKVGLNELTTSPLNDMLWRYNAHVGLRSLPNASGRIYSGEVSYDVFHSDNGLQEHLIKTQYGFSNPLRRSRVGMDFELTNMFYRKNNFPAINFWNYYAIFAMNPYFLKEKENWFIRVGLNAAFSFIHGRPFNPMPDVAASWNIVPKYLSLYGGIKGSFTPSTLSSIYAENPYVFPDLRVKDTYTPFNPYAGFKFKILPTMLIDVYVDYRTIEDQYFFVNKTYETNDVPGDRDVISTNRFDAIYSDASLFRLGSRINYNYKNVVTVQLKGNYNRWDVSNEPYAWMKPGLEADLSTDVKVNSKLSFSAIAFYEGDRFARLGNLQAVEMQPKLDINLGAAYNFNRNLSAFARINNLLNSQYEQYYGYEIQGINFLLGGTVAF